MHPNKGLNAPSSKLANPLYSNSMRSKGVFTRSVFWPVILTKNNAAFKEHNGLQTHSVRYSQRHH